MFFFYGSVKGHCSSLHRSFPGLSWLVNFTVASAQGRMNFALLQMRKRTACKFRNTLSLGLSKYFTYMGQLASVRNWRPAWRTWWNPVSTKNTKKQNKTKKKLGAVAHAYNPSTLGDQGGRITWGREFMNSLANMAKPHLYKKYENEPGVVACACSPSYLGGWGGRSPDPKRSRLQWAVIEPLHSRLGNRGRPSL